MTEAITTADLAAEMFAADMSVEDEIAQLRNRARSAALADLFGPHLPAHLPPLRLNCLTDCAGNPRLSASPVKSRTPRGTEAQAEAFAAWLVDQGVEDYTVKVAESEPGPTMFAVRVHLAGLAVTLRLFFWPWEVNAEAAEALVAKAIEAARADAVEVAA
ncbi:hypothetical protein [Glycomyces tenuis]|uniref:hypothetical protein n=1 Tax=Glycomyces tenuis TaxID=58116 RepID=UPI00041B002E|nr:hypothetical protein [Glycomyces tenuis]